MARQMLLCVPQTLVAYRQLLDDVSGMTFADALRFERAASLANNVPVSREDIDARLAGLRRRAR
jgi:hypothetical protein